MPNSTSYTLPNLHGLSDFAAELIRLYGQSKVWAFRGEMGAGKTTLIQAILNNLGIQELNGSPTYSLVNVYETAHKEVVYHFDLYRLNLPQEALDIGIEDMLYGTGRCLIEWPEIIEDLLPDETIWFNLSILDDNQNRLLTVSP